MLRKKIQYFLENTKAIIFKKNVFLGFRASFFSNCFVFTWTTYGWANTPVARSSSSVALCFNHGQIVSFLKCLKIYKNIFVIFLNKLVLKF